jgi:hypothetical protein
MIYTVGRKEGYEHYLNTDPNPGKAKGGSVWRHYEHAKIYLQRTQQHDYDVYAVDADWLEDVIPDPEAPHQNAVSYIPWCQLKRDAKLLRVNKNETEQRYM